MSGAQQVLAGIPPGGIDAADFDGTNDYMTRGAGLTGAADSKSGILSVWVRLDAGTGTQRFISGSTALGGAPGNFFRAGRLIGPGVFLIAGANAAGTGIFQIQTTASFSASATWRHVLASWDLAAAAAHLYVNDVSDLSAVVLTDDTLDYTLGDWGIGGDANAASKLDGCLAELYFAPGQFIDLSVEANRRKFISAAGKPAYLGQSGRLPTGTAPIVYQHIGNEPVARFGTNRGTGGNFAITGTLDTGSTSPSD